MRGSRMGGYGGGAGMRAPSGIGSSGFGGTSGFIRMPTQRGANMSYKPSDAAMGFQRLRSTAFIAMQ